jgi:exosortase
VRGIRLSRSTKTDSSVITIGVVLVLAVMWAYWSTLVAIAERWSHPQYSHGYLVPVFAVVLLWLRRSQFQEVRLQMHGWGLLLLGMGLGMRLWATYFYVTWFDGLSLLPVLGGIALLLGGWRCLRWAAPGIAFLFFMVPLPFRLEHGMGGPLQRFAAITSTYLLQTVGQPAIREGNVIVIGETRLGVVEACSGLRMLFIFFAVSSAVALLIHRSRWEKLVIVLSAVPIALFVNVMRITVTGALYVTAGSKLADAVFHDFAGWVMMPAALLLLWLELKYLSYLIVDARTAPVSIQASASVMGIREQMSQQAARGRVK